MPFSYLINMNDGRLFLYTKQVARQINYHPISDKVAQAIIRKEVDPELVISRIKASLINNSTGWDELLKDKAALNTAKVTVTAADRDMAETVIDPNSPREEAFDMDIPDAPPPGEVPGAPEAPGADAEPPEPPEAPEAPGKAKGGKAKGKPGKGGKDDVPAGGGPARRVDDIRDAIGSPFENL